MLAPRIRTILLALVVVALVWITPTIHVVAQSDSLNGITIVVDPGHGGNDFGVDPAGSGLSEKTLNLDLAERLVPLLEAEGANVVVTRTTDQFVSLNARVRFNNALLFRPDNGSDRGRLVSIHNNSNPEAPNLRRVEVLVDPQADGPFDFAADMAARLRAVTGGSVGYVDTGYPDGVHPADVAPVRWTYPRGQNILTESAFLSNREQAAQLKNPAFLDAIVEAHVVGLRTELGR